jgi:hypothetical protein
LRFATVSRNRSFYITAPIIFPSFLTKRNHIQNTFQRGLQAAWHILCESDRRITAFKQRALSFLEPWGGAMIATNFRNGRINGLRMVTPPEERRRNPRHPHCLPLTLSVFNREQIFEGRMIN